MNPTSPDSLASGVRAPEIVSSAVPFPGEVGRRVGAERGRRGFERVRKPVALLCLGVWLLAALRLPMVHARLVDFGALLGHVLVGVAVFGRIWSTLHIGGHKNGRLCRSGPYGRTRNPLYFFSWLGVTGIALVFREPWLTPLAWVGFAVCFAPLIQTEEARLGRLFGAEYDRYRREVPRFFPDLGKRAGLPDSLEETPGKLRLIERSLADALWFLIAAAAVETLVTSGGWERLRELAR